MKLQKQMSRKIGDTEYAKYVIVIPPKVIQEIQWQEGEELKISVQGKKIIVEKS